ncbi:MAG: SLC13 family permease, partial [Chloroflexota bacterium]
TSRQEEPSLRTSKAPLNLVIFISMITLVGLGWLHISVAAVLGAVLSVLTGCLTMDEAYKSIEWKSVYLIAGMLPMGIAMEKTGTALFLSEQIINMVGGLGPRGIMVGLFVLTTLLTAFMSNAAAAVLVAPIAIQSAYTLGIEPHAFVMGTAIAASNSFVTPIGHQACVLVYGPGGYRFFDFARVGLPLTIIIWVLMTIFLPIFFPFYPA